MSALPVRPFLIGYKATAEEIEKLDEAVRLEGLPNRSVLLRKIVNGFLGLSPLPTGPFEDEEGGQSS